MKIVIALIFAILAFAPFVNADNCNICEIIVAGAELFISNDPAVTQQEVEDYLHNVCNISFLKPYEAECQILLSVYADKIIQELFAGTPGAQVCAAIHLCPAEKPLAKLRPMAVVINASLIKRSITSDCFSSSFLFFLIVI